VDTCTLNPEGRDGGSLNKGQAHLGLTLFLGRGAARSGVLCGGPPTTAARGKRRRRRLLVGL